MCTGWAICLVWEIFRTASHLRAQAAVDLSHNNNNYLAISRFFGLCMGIMAKLLMLMLVFLLQPNSAGFNWMITFLFLSFKGSNLAFEQVHTTLWTSQVVQKSSPNLCPMAGAPARLQALRIGPRQNSRIPNIHCSLNQSFKMYPFQRLRRPPYSLSNPPALRKQTYQPSYRAHSAVQACLELLNFWDVLQTICLTICPSSFRALRTPSQGQVAGWLLLALELVCRGHVLTAHTCCGSLGQALNMRPLRWTQRCLERWSVLLSQRLQGYAALALFITAHRHWRGMNWRRQCSKLQRPLWRLPPSL